MLCNLLGRESKTVHSYGVSAWCSRYPVDYISMLPTPSTAHVSYDNVYEPAEDSYLCMDTLSSDSEAAFFRERFGNNAVGGRSTLVVTEVGTGSGVLLAFLTANAKIIFGADNVVTMGTDVNHFACRATVETVKVATTNPGTVKDAARKQGSLGEKHHAIFLDAVEADLVAPIRAGMVDVLVFNPPYVPTPGVPDLKWYEGRSVSPTKREREQFERDSHLLALAYSGGIDGMETTNRFLQQLPETLSSRRGVAYVLLCAQNRPGDVKNRIRSLGPGWMAETVATSGKRAGWEKLQVVRIWQS